MKAPAGMRPLTAIRADIDEWVAENTYGSPIPAAGIHCNTCSAIIQRTTLYASQHDSHFPDCAGGGEVTNLVLPYCPTCEPDVPTETQRTCIHEEAA